MSLDGGVGGRFEECEMEGETGSGMPAGVEDREFAAIEGLKGEWIGERPEGKALRWPVCERTGGGRRRPRGLRRLPTSKEVSGAGVELDGISTLKLLGLCSRVGGRCGGNGSSGYSWVDSDRLLERATEETKRVVVLSG